MYVDQTTKHGALCIITWEHVKEGKTSILVDDCNFDDAVQQHLHVEQ